MSEENTGKIVRYTYDPRSPRHLSEEARTRFDAIKDEDIDLSDIPDQSGRGGWSMPSLSRGPAGRLQREALEEKILVLDDDVADFFRTSEELPTKRMNAVLREYVEAQRKSA